MLDIEKCNNIYKKVFACLLVAWCARGLFVDFRWKILGILLLSLPCFYWFWSMAVIGMVQSWNEDHKINSIWTYLIVLVISNIIVGSLLFLVGSCVGDGKIADDYEYWEHATRF